MKSSQTLLACVTVPGGGLGFIVGCDGLALRWLARSFRTLGTRKSFRLGDGLPIGSDGNCSIEVTAGVEEQHTAIAPLTARCFRWVLPVGQARRYAGLIDAMADYPRACHQYLEAGKAGVPITVISKGEYDADTLRQMRGARPRGR